MAVQQIYILVSKKYIQAGYFHDNEITAISIDGNLKITYSSDSDFERLIDAIKDTFNVDELNDVELSITIISCGAITSITDHLYEKIKTSKQHYLLNAETVIPFICTCKGLLTNKQIPTISILDSLYQISEREEGRVFCCQLNDDDSEMEVHTLELSDLTSIVNFDITKLGMDDSIVAQFNKTIDELRTEIKKIKTENTKQSKKIKKLNEDVLSYKNRYEQAVLQNQSLFVSSRKLLRFDKTFITINKKENFPYSKNEIYKKICEHFSIKRQSIGAGFLEKSLLHVALAATVDKGTKKLKFKSFVLLKKDLQLVLKGESLIRFKFSDGSNGTGECDFIAPCKGKLFLRDNVENYFDDNCIIGCICHPDDDENLVKLWLETQPRV